MKQTGKLAQYKPEVAAWRSASALGMIAVLQVGLFVTALRAQDLVAEPTTSSATHVTSEQGPFEDVSAAHSQLIADTSGSLAKRCFSTDASAQILVHRGT